MKIKQSLSGLVLLLTMLLIAAPATSSEITMGGQNQVQHDGYQLAQRDNGRERYKKALTCNSKDYRRNYCRANIAGRVTLVRQTSESACIEGRSWGYDERGIWVDNGCQATFSYSEWSDDDSRLIQNGDNVALCQKMVRWEIGKEYGDRAEVRFYSGQSYDTSRRQIAVEGEGQLRTRGDKTRFSYDCMVDRRQGRVSDVNYRLRDRPRDNEWSEATVDRCQSAVVDRVSRDLGYQPRLRFEPAQVSYPERDRQSVRGEARLQARRGSDTITYRCRVNTRRNRVTDVSYDYR